MGAAIELPELYTPVQPNGDVPRRADELEPIGSGGSSIVYRARYRNSLERAVKILNPREDLKDVDITEFEASFLNEVRVLSTITHENIAKLVDFGFQQDGAPYTYVVTEFVQGTPIDTFVADSRTSAADFLDILQQLLRGLEYLHLHRILHCDVKPGNILVNRRPDNTCHAILLDLGVSKYLPDSLTEKQKEHFTYYFTTERYAHPQLRDNVSNKTLNKTKVGRLLALFPGQDIYAFAVTVEELLSETMAEKLRSHLGDEGLDTLRKVLQDARTSLHPATSAQVIAGELQRLSTRQLCPLDIEELAAVPPQGRRIMFSGGRILVTNRMQSLVDHPLMQRIQRVPQLDLMPYVFPSARHSRYEHALVTLDLARQSILHLLDDRTFRLGATKEEVEGYLLMALLGDTGHFQFLHMFEDFLRYRSSDYLVDAGLLNDDEVCRRLVGVDQDAAGDLTGLIETQDENGRTLHGLIDEYFHEGWRDTIRTLAQPSVTPIQCTLSGLLSSPIDIEKLAYLRLDASNTGLPFGRVVDPEAIFSAIVVPSLQEIERLKEPQMKPQGTLGIRESAISFVEASVLARYWQIQRGYWHVTNRSLQAMVKWMIWQLLKNGALKYGEFLTETAFMGVNSAMVYLSDRFERLRGQGLVDESATNPIAGLLHSRREIYTRILAISPESKVPSRRSDHLVYEWLEHLSPLEEEQVVAKIGQVMRDTFHGVDVRMGDVLLDVPKTKREMLGGRVLVYSDDKEEMLGELFELSPLVDNLKESFDQYAKRLRVFIHPRVAKVLEDQSAIPRAREVVFEYLREQS